MSSAKLRTQGTCFLCAGKEELDIVRAARGDMKRKHFSLLKATTPTKGVRNRAHPDPLGSLAAALLGRISVLQKLLDLFGVVPV